MISIGVLGPATFNSLPSSSVILRTLPKHVPTTIGSPCFKVPFCTSNVATGPLPLSSFASITVPVARRLGFALSSCISATVRIVSSNSWIPSPFFADVLTKILSPPHSSGMIPCSASSLFTLSGFAVGLSILFTAIIIGTFAALAWSIASSVWGITPSSAATTIIAISVTLAPLARIAVNASWPGVSKNVTFLPFTLIW